MTEDALVAALRAIVEAPAVPSGLPRRIVLGIGDDAAVWQPSRSHLSVVTTDALVDGVHFDRMVSEPRAIGKRAMAANLSDVAAMGARPVLATVALGVAPGTSEAWLLECYRGLAEVAARYDAYIVGGDIVRTPSLTLSLTVVGEVSRSRLKRRDGGRPGDVVAVTGPLGASRAGLEISRRPLPVALQVRAEALAAFETPAPRLREGRFLAASAHVRAMMDSSDGLSTDLARLALASGCGATIEDVPVHPVAAAVAEAAGDAARGYALDGGEDFELIVAVAPRAFGHLAARFGTAFGKPLLRVGRLDAEPGIRLSSAGASRDLEPAGWDHLR
ncbi:MAG: thiamine-phosphate kinase [Candidatus Eremiobacteraeota bacterium]|nr:thiamine-phosphate kinase [Candidatus Eremiobacteraeota bacterium]